MWIIVMFYQLFGLSFWRHPLTAEDALLSKLCNATFHQVGFWWRNKLIYILDSMRVNFQEIFTYSHLQRNGPENKTFYDATEIYSSQK